MHSSLKNVDAATLARFYRANHIRRLSLFGSQLKETAESDSDIGLLVAFEPAHIPGLIAAAGMENQLSVLPGCRVDSRTAQDLSRHFRDDVVHNAQIPYAGEDRVRIERGIDAAETVA